MLLSHPSSCMLVNHGPSQQNSKEENKPWKWGATARYYTSHIHTSCYQLGSLCQDPAGNWTTQRPPDHRKETPTAVVWSCFPSIRSGQNHLARHSERGKKTRRTKEEVGRQHQGMDKPGVRQVPEGSGEQGNMEKTGWKIICGAPTTLAVKGLMMMIMRLLYARLPENVMWRQSRFVYACLPETSCYTSLGWCMHVYQIRPLTEV